MGRASLQQWTGFTAESNAPLTRGGPLKGLSWIGGALATAAAVTLAAVLTVVFAATLAVIIVLSTGLIALYALTHGKRRSPQGVLIEARKVGHSWVAYGWDQRPR